MDSGPQVLCPTCREAIPDRAYYAHQLQPSHNPFPDLSARLETPTYPVNYLAGVGKPQMVLAGWDLSQIEARVELMLAASTTEFHGSEIGKECVRLATAHPEDFDIHTYVAAIALDKPESEITDLKGGDQPSERQIGKTTGHGWMRGMGAQTMSDNYLKKGWVITPETCSLRLARLDMKLPVIRGGFMPDVCRQIMRFRGLATTFGGIWRCDWQALGEELYGSGYSYQPQRECVDLLNQCSLLPLRNAIRARMGDRFPIVRIPRLQVHAHDALLSSMHPDDVYPVFKFVDQTLAKTVRRYYSGELPTYVTYQVGSTWKAKVEWKRLPNEKECRDAAWACIEGDGEWGFVREAA